ncbi:MAG: MEKHLA domain-containing protein, partial [Cyanobacteria bacterium P01_H01_bin.15]
GCDRENLTPLEQAEKLYQADFVVVSHNTASDPIFNYANAIAQKLWELDWEQFTQTPSRLTAEPPTRSEREELLAAVRRQGYIDNYWGVRVTPSGRRFRIEQVTVWNLYDAENNYQGQAATFRNWVDL